MNCPHCGGALPTPAEQERADIQGDEETPPQIVRKLTPAEMDELAGYPLDHDLMRRFKWLWDTDTQD